MLLKPAYNEEYRVYDFTPQLADGETVNSAALSVFRADSGADVTITMVSDVAVYNQRSIRYKLFGGTAGLTYVRRFRVVTSQGQKLEETALVKVV